jgi:hypothetical protein
LSGYTERERTDVTPLFSGVVDKFRPVIAMKLQKQEWKRIDNVPQRLESPFMGFLSEVNPA